MKLFKSKATPDADGFFTVVAADKVQPEAMVTAVINGKSVILTRLDGQIYAFTGVCPHAAADLAAGCLYRGKIECPDHGYCFDIRSGRTLWPEDEMLRLRRYEVKEEGGVVKVKLDR